MSLSNTAFIFIGYQNDYFAVDGILRGVVEEADRTRNILSNSLALLGALEGHQTTLIQTPIIFTADYSELVNPVGILKVIQEVGAFKQGSPGAEIIDEFKAQGERISIVEGKRGLNAFSNTALDNLLTDRGITHIVLAGAVTSICIDSTGRAAHERGFSVTVLSDCTASRSQMEQDFYCDNIFPLYARVTDSQSLLTELVPNP